MTKQHDQTSSFDPSIRPQLPYENLHGRYGPYVPDHDLIDAANVALTLQLPLLLTGEPGCGKTEFAYVAAHELCEPGEKEPLECQIRSDARARDLLYHYDPIRRFAEGQHGDPEAKKRAFDARRYVELRPLGTALMSSNLRVVLIDEIDKAPRDLPNDLLRELDRKRRQFEISEITDADAETYGPWKYCGVPLRREMKPPAGAPMPFVVITSNTERQLPDAFLRRCVFFHIDFPKRERLRKILEEHIRAENDKGATQSESRLRLRNPIDPDKAEDKEYISQLVDIFQRAREIPNLAKKPSTAEWLDWVGALDCFVKDDIRARLRRFWHLLHARQDPSPNEDKPTWLALPARACLFKLHEDLVLAEKAALG